MGWNEMRAYVWMRVGLSQCADKDPQAAICQPGEWVIRGNLPGNVKIDPGNLEIEPVCHYAFSISKFFGCQSRPQNGRVWSNNGRVYRMDETSLYAS